MFCEYESGNATFEQFELAVLGSFNLPSRKHIDALIARFEDGLNRGKE
jgi:hypothetical protein